MSDPRVIKKYPNRRLYDTVESRYITLADVRRLVAEHIDFIVVDKKDNTDISREILLQVIADLEHLPEPILSQAFLIDLIRAYGTTAQRTVGGHLQQTLRIFMTQQPLDQQQPQSVRERLKPFTPPPRPPEENYKPLAAGRDAVSFPK